MAGAAISRTLVLVVFAFATSGCLFFPTEHPVHTYGNARRIVTGEGLNPDVPDVTIMLNAAGGDAIDVYSPGSDADRIRIAEAAAAALGVEGALAEENEYLSDTATVQLGDRLLRRDGDDWRLSFDSAPLLPIIEDEGYDGFNLIVCHPQVETATIASRPADYGVEDIECFNGRGWEVVDEPVSVSLTLMPDAGDYLLFVAVTLLAIVLLSALAWFVGSKLREGPFRRRTPPAVAVGLIVGLIAIGGIASTFGIAASELGPSDNLALAEDLTAGLYALSAALPALAGTIPGVLFTVLLVKRRPWPEEPPEYESRPWPAPPPPPPTPGSAPPPPLPGGVR